MPKKQQSKRIQIYVDGSYIDGITGYGFVVIQNGQKIYESNGMVSAEAAQGTRQVAGELVAVGNAVKWCKQSNITDVDIFFDYEGIRSWATGKWKTNLDLTRRYADFIAQSGLNIRWHKVKSHTGNYWNDYADELAKNAVLSYRHEASQLEQSFAASEQNDTTYEQQKHQILIHTAQDFCHWIRAHSQGWEASFDKIYNDMYARVNVSMNGERIGIFDLYNTAKKPMSPCIHSALAPEINRLQELWNSYRAHCGI